MALENVIKAIMNVYQNVQRGGRTIGTEEIEAALRANSPGSPFLAILCFENSDHGTTLGTLSASQANPFAKLDVPRFQWPVAPFPQYRYPLEENHFHNKCQDNTCLATIEDLIYRRDNTG